MTHEHGVAGIDPHKNSATIAVLDQRGGVVGSESFPITEEGIDRLLTFLLGIELTIDRIGVEGSGFLGRPLVLALTAAGYDVREVQANRTAERRKRRRRAKTDIEDAEAIARETLADPHLPPAGKHATPSPAWQTLTVLRDWRASLVLQRVRLLTEAEAVLVNLPVAIRNALPVTSRVLPQLVALAEDRVAPGGLGPADRLKLERLATSLLDNHHTDPTDQGTRPADSRDARRARIHAYRPARCRCRDGDDLLVEIGDPDRFTTEAQTARWCGTAPVAVSFGEGQTQPDDIDSTWAGNRAGARRSGAGPDRQSSSIGRRATPSRSATPVRAFGPVRWGPWLQTTLRHLRAG